MRVACGLPHRTLEWTPPVNPLIIVIKIIIIIIIIISRRKLVPLHDPMYLE